MQPVCFNLTGAGDHVIRGQIDGRHTIWFLASDIARAVSETDTFDKHLASLFTDVPNIWKKIDSFGDESAETRLFLSDLGVFCFLGSYKKKSNTVRAFQDSLIKDILPAVNEIMIQKEQEDTKETGQQHVEEIRSDPDAFIKTLQAYKAEKELREQAEAKNLALEAEKIKLEEVRSSLETKIANDADKVKLAEAFETCPTTISIGSFAKVLQNAGYKIAEKKLFSLLYKHKYLIRRGRRKRTAYQKWINDGYFDVTEKIMHLKDGTENLIVTTMITGKGQKYLLKVIPRLLLQDEKKSK